MIFAVHARDEASKVPASDSRPLARTAANPNDAFCIFKAVSNKLFHRRNKILRPVRRCPIEFDPVIRNVGFCAVAFPVAAR